MFAGLQHPSQAPANVMVLTLPRHPRPYGVALQTTY
jgi:hypothetical protein